MNEDVRVLFRDLADLTPAQREDQYALRNVPTDIRAEVESLLSFDSALADVMSDVIGAAAEEFLLTAAPLAPGGRVGVYRLVRLLGTGGMGAVYLAERDDGEVRQQVAIKFLRHGWSQPDFRDRFLRERQILASLNHPGIARLLDAGHAMGHPYLVMEYVDGTKIDDYAARLGMREIIELIRHVGEAVSYAHRNLIIHRDLKPSNIMIGADGKPKLLDFGIAKLLDAEDETQTLAVAMTPEYASPEQLRGEAQATTTDIYSLGAVMYRLLTGESPRTPSNSTRELLPKDVAAILRMAMREEPDERYASVELFLADLDAYLSNKPVQACKGDFWYSAGKFTRRHWLPVCASLLAVAGLTGGLLAANHERAIAQRRFLQVRQLSKQFLDLDHELRNLPGSTSARNRIVTASLQYLEGLGNETKRTRWQEMSAEDADLTLDIASAYARVARVQGVPGPSNLGQFEQAKQSLARAGAYVEPLLRMPGFSQRRKALLLSNEIAHDSMVIASVERRSADAVALAKKGAAGLEEFEKLGELSEEELLSCARMYANLAMSHLEFHLVHEASVFARRGIALARRLKRDDRALSQSLGVFANAARYAGDFDGALKAIRESRAIAERDANSNDAARVLMVAAALWREGVLLGELNNVNMVRPQEAIPLLSRAYEMAEGLAARDAADYTSRSYVSMAGRELGDLLRDAQPARALAIYDHTLSRLMETTNDKTRRDSVWLLIGSSYALRRLGQNAQAGRRLAQAEQILRDLNVYPSERMELGDEADVLMRAIGDHLAEAGQTRMAIETYEDLLARVQASQPHPESDLRHANGLSRIHSSLISLYRKAGREAEAAKLERIRLAMWSAWDRQLPRNAFVQWQLSLAADQPVKEVMKSTRN